MAAQVPTDEADGEHKDEHQAEVGQDEAQQQSATIMSNTIPTRRSIRRRPAG